MSEPDFTETLSGPKGFTPDFAAALAHAQSLSKDEAEAVIVAATIVDYAGDPMEDAAGELAELQDDLADAGSDAPAELAKSVKVVEALWLAAKGDGKAIDEFPSANRVRVGVSFIEPEIRDSKRETKLVLTTNPSYYDDTLNIFMLSGAGEAAGFDDLDSLDLDEGKSLLSEIKQKFGVVSSGPEI